MGLCQVLFSSAINRGYVIYSNISFYFLTAQYVMLENAVGEYTYFYQALDTCVFSPSTLSLFDFQGQWIIASYNGSALIVSNYSSSTCAGLPDFSWDYSEPFSITPNMIPPLPAGETYIVLLATFSSCSPQIIVQGLIYDPTFCHNEDTQSSMLTCVGMSGGETKSLQIQNNNGNCTGQGVCFSTFLSQ